MSHAKGDYHWWDLDGSELAGILYAASAPIQLGDDDYNNDWDEFQRRNPAGAYAWSVGSQHEVFDQAIIGLRPVQKLVRVRRLPIATTRGNITREEWLRATIDLFLFRLGGIRDHCLHRRSSSSTCPRSRSSPRGSWGRQGERRLSLKGWSDAYSDRIRSPFRRDPIMIPEAFDQGSGAFDR